MGYKQIAEADKKCGPKVRFGNSLRQPLLHNAAPTVNVTYLVRAVVGNLR
jgi:hypothetical protein